MAAAATALTCATGLDGDSAIDVEAEEAEDAGKEDPGEDVGFVGSWG